MIRSTPISDTMKNISDLYINLQITYEEWASNFSTHDDVFRWLEVNGIKTAGIKKKSDFSLHSSQWNSITVSVINKLAPHLLDALKEMVENLFKQEPAESHRDLWYLLFFIHPVRHELYYFDDHYPFGYEGRLAKLLKSHRMGLKAAKSYLDSRENLSLEDPFIKACGTVSFKHLLLHPTTAQWGLEPGDLFSSLKRLCFDGGGLSGHERINAMLLSRESSLLFNQWITYAPCAINEGPIFLPKADCNLPECFSAIVQILSEEPITQLKLRECLQEFFNIKVVTRS
jgi:hypothetical protein